MTYSSPSNSTEQQAAEASPFAGGDKPEPKYFIENPLAFEITNNEYTSAPYYYDYARNAWIFYVPGTDIPNPPLDPDGGNLWIDPTNMYLMYVYNENEMVFPEAEEQRWYALTTNKRAYDYLIVPIANDGDDVSTLVPPERVNIFKQGFLFFSSVDKDLKVKVMEEGGVSQAWASITQRGIEAVEDPLSDFNDTLPAMPLRHLRSSIDSLQARVDALKQATIS